MSWGYINGGGDRRSVCLVSQPGELDWPELAEEEKVGTLWQVLALMYGSREGQFLRAEFRSEAPKRSESPK